MTRSRSGIRECIDRILDVVEDFRDLAVDIRVDGTKLSLQADLAKGGPRPSQRPAAPVTRPVTPPGRRRGRGRAATRVAAAEADAGARSPKTKEDVLAVLGQPANRRGLNLISLAKALNVRKKMKIKELLDQMLAAGEIVFASGRFYRLPGELPRGRRPATGSTPAGGAPARRRRGAGRRRTGGRPPRRGGVARRRRAGGRPGRRSGGTGGEPGGGAAGGGQASGRRGGRPRGRARKAPGAEKAPVAAGPGPRSDPSPNDKAAAPIEILKPDQIL